MPETPSSTTEAMSASRCWTSNDAASTRLAYMSAITPIAGMASTVTEPSTGSRRISTTAMITNIAMLAIVIGSIAKTRRTCERSLDDRAMSSPVAVRS